MLLRKPFIDRHPTGVEKSAETWAGPAAIAEEDMGSAVQAAEAIAAPIALRLVSAGAREWMKSSPARKQRLPETVVRNVRRAVRSDNPRRELTLNCRDEGHR
jgi:hypothetical protein